MRQVLFDIPVRFADWLPAWWPNSLPVFGFGTMLVIALFLGVWLAGRRAKKEGIPKEHIQDVAFWIVIAGIVGARTVHLIQFNQPWSHFFYFWEGGLVFYGSLIGGVVGYLLGYYFVLMRHGLSGWKLADIIAPSAALGVAIGRVGCLLNGCCYGNVACPDCAAVTFPIQSFPWERVVKDGYDTAAGFTMKPFDDARDGKSATVGAVDPKSAAGQAGLEPGDLIVKATNADGSEERIKNYAGLESYFLLHWPRGQTQLRLTVERDGKEVGLPPFAPRTIGLHPTQVYETVSMFLLFLLLMAYYPFRRHDGEVFAIFLICYPLHRFLDEMLRNDTDPVAFGMTLSQNGSLLLLIVAVGIWVWLSRQPAQYHPFKAEPAKAG